MAIFGWHFFFEAKMWGRKGINKSEKLVRYPILDVLKRKKGDTKLQSGSRRSSRKS